MSLTLPGFWNIANQFTSKFDWSPLIDNPHWIEHPHLIPQLTRKMQTAFHTMTTREANVPFITLLDPEYPEKLRSVPFAPPVLFYSGNIDLLHRSSVAILGSRRCTQQGVIRSRSLARYFSPTHNIMGGLTKGIEYQAQRALLDLSKQSDCAIINITTHGFQQIGGWSRRHLDHTLERGGLVLSESDGATPYRRWQYAQRNRIIAALTSIAIVVEAGVQSGCLKTATMAAEHGANVYSFPHHSNQLHGQGCNEIIEQGATPIERNMAWKSEVDSTLLNILHSPQTLTQIAQHLETSETDALLQLSIWQKHGYIRQRGILWERH